ncbi:MAG TPA: sigma-70 family RNA polymerase sigma factor [Chthoniobacterales bacterium]
MTPSPDDADVSAMCRLRGGDDLALNEIMGRWQRRVVAFLLRYTGNEATAVDLAQETFVRVYQNRERYESRAAFSTWLFAIATNQARQHFRWQKRHPTFSLDAELEDPEGKSTNSQLSADCDDPRDAALREEKARLVRACVLALPHDLREAVILSEYEEFSHQEIARIAGCTAKAVETRLYRARAILREKLARFLR